MRKILLASFLIASPAWGHAIECPTGGTDGSRVAASAGTTETAGKIASLDFQQEAYWLCCNRGVAACTDKDLTGGADAYIVSLEDLNTCSAVDVTIGFRNDATGVNQTVGTLSLGTTSLVIPGPRNRFVTATVNTATGCGGGDGVDVRLDVFHGRVEGK